MGILGLLVLLTISVLPCARCQNAEILMVVAGYTADGTDTADVEAIDLSSNQLTCEKPPDYPFPTEGGIIAINSENHPIVCGGRESDVIAVGDCYEFRPVEKEWRKFGNQMIVPRIWSTPVQLADGKVWITGGVKDGLALASTEVLNPFDGTFERGQDMPTGPLCLHCAVRIDDDRIFVAGGSDGNYRRSNQTYVVNIADNTWESVAPMQVERSGHACMLVGRDIIVAGNVEEHDGITEIFNLDTMQWRQGPVLDIAQAAALPYRDTFLLIGGFAEGSVELNTIYEYDKSNEAFLARPEKLSVPRDTPLSVLVGDSIVSCT